LVKPPASLLNERVAAVNRLADRYVRKPAHPKMPWTQPP